MARPLLADTITRLGPEAAGAVLVTGSHGGVYAAYLAARAKLRAVVFNDAGGGLEQAGIAGLAWLAGRGMAAASVDYRSARIGDAADMFARGRISHANAQARACGVEKGQACTEAAALLEKKASVPQLVVAPMDEARQVVPGSGCRLVLVDSAALVLPEDAGQLVVTGSHGALFGNDPANALKVEARLAAFNDAGLGPGEVGASRLPALQSRGIAAVTLAAATAKIGDARSGWVTGVISRSNALAEAMGAHEGIPLRRVIEAICGIAPPEAGQLPE